MISPDFRSFKQLAQKGNLVAILRTIPADIETPVSSFLKIARREPYAFLLESAEQEEKIGRYSFLGIAPEAVITAHKERITINQQRGKPLIQTASDLVTTLEQTLKKFRLANPQVLPGFSGGFLGFLSYEQVQNFESIRLRKKPDGKTPEGIFFLVKDFLMFDHFRKTLTVISIAEIGKNGRSLLKSYQQAVTKINRAVKILEQPLRLKQSVKTRKPVKAISNMSQQAFMAKVRKIKEYIRAGDCIQVVLSQRFTLPNVQDDFQIYRALRSINPSPYMFYFKAKSLRLIGASPELLVRKIGREAEVRPIAGTRPRGQTISEDLALEGELKRSSKEMAEHLMLVDLGRNDLGRVCDFKSIQVKNFARVERYSHVMHLVSDVVGALKKGKTSFDLLRATFPAGTVTGAPKVRAMQIIDELESEARGPYAGCLGFFGFNHDMETCITIRTLVAQGNHIYLQAGAGVVKDSQAKREYQETLNKAKALVKAVELQGSF